MGKFFNETRIGVARTTAQLMIEMANNEPLVTKTDEVMQQRDRIAAAGDADEVALPRRKLPENFQVEARGELFGLAAFVLVLMRGARRGERLADVAAKSHYRVFDNE